VLATGVGEVGTAHFGRAECEHCRMKDHHRVAVARGATVRELLVEKAAEDARSA